MNVLQIVLRRFGDLDFNDTIVQLENAGVISTQFAAKPRCVTSPTDARQDTLDVAFRVVLDDEDGHPVLTQRAGGKVNGLL
jgi:hypothetical protein